jgi:hypothetical protein
MNTHHVGFLQKFGLGPWLCCPLLVLITLGSGGSAPLEVKFAQIKRGYKIRVYTNISSDAAKKTEVSTLIARIKLAQGFDKTVLERIGILCANGYYKNPKAYLCDLGRLGPLDVSYNGNAFLIQLDPSVIGEPPLEDVPLELYAKSFNNFSKEPYIAGPIKIIITGEPHENRSSLEAKYMRIFKVSFLGINLDKLLGFQPLHWWVDGADDQVPLINHPGLGSGQNTFSLVRNDLNPGQISGKLTDQGQTIQVHFDDENAFVSGEYSGTLKGIRSASADSKDLRLVVRVSSAPIIPALLLAAGLVGGFFFRRYIGIITQTEGLLIRIHATINRFLGQQNEAYRRHGTPGRYPLEQALLAKARSLEHQISDFRAATPITMDPTSGSFVALKTETSSFEQIPATWLKLLEHLSDLRQQRQPLEITLRHAQTQLATRSATGPAARPPAIEVLETIQRLLDETRANQDQADIAGATANGDWRTAGQLADQQILACTERTRDAGQLANNIPALEGWADRAVSLNSSIAALSAQITSPTLRSKRLISQAKLYLGRAGDELFTTAMPDLAQLEKVLTKAASSLRELERQGQGTPTLPPFQAITDPAPIVTAAKVVAPRFVWHGLLGLTLQTLGWLLLLILTIGLVFALSIRLSGSQGDRNFALAVAALVLALLAPIGLVYSSSRWFALRQKIFGTWIVSSFSLRDLLVLVIPFLPLLVVAFNDFAGNKPTFGTLSDDLAALTWGIGSQTAVQALFSFIERLPLARSLVVQT